MPHVTFFTNVARSRLPATFGKQFTELLAKSLNKPVNSVSLVLMPEALLSHGTSDCPTCLIVLKAIGSFSAERNIKYSAAISQFMKEQIGVEPEHCVIQFMNMEPENVSICGTTVKVLNEKGNK